MKIGVGELKKVPGSNAEFAWEEKWPPLTFEGQEVPFTGPVVVQVLVTNTGKNFMLTGKAKATVELYCSRCLATFTYPLEVSLTEQYCSPHFWQGLPEYSDLRDELRVFAGDTLDIAPAVKEALLLALPMKPLCREACRGLCPHCGQDLNQCDCECHRDKADSRLAALQELLR